VDDVLETVDGGDLAFATLVGASYDSDFVVLSDGDGADLEGVRRMRKPQTQAYERCISLGAPCSKARS